MIIEFSFESQLRDRLRQSRGPRKPWPFPKGILVGGNWYADAKPRLVNPWAQTATPVEDPRLR